MVLLDQLNSVLTAAQVPLNLQIPWREALNCLQPKEVQMMVTILGRTIPQEIVHYSSLLQKKINSLRKRDGVLWEGIITEERKRLIHT